MPRQALVCLSTWTGVARRCSRGTHALMAGLSSAVSPRRSSAGRVVLHDHRSRRTCASSRRQRPLSALGFAPASDAGRMRRRGRPSGTSAPTSSHDPCASLPTAWWTETECPAWPRQLGYSTRQLERLLLAEVGAGPLALARIERAQTARLLLERTGLPSAQIASPLASRASASSMTRFVSCSRRPRRNFASEPAPSTSPARRARLCCACRSAGHSAARPSSTSWLLRQRRGVRSCVTARTDGQFGSRMATRSSVWCRRRTTWPVISVWTTCVIWWRRCTGAALAAMACLCRPIPVLSGRPGCLTSARQRTIRPARRVPA
jgi:hypothetical protein